MDGLDDLIPILFHFGGGLFFFKEWPSIQNDIRDKAFGYNWGGMPKHRWEKFYWDVTYPYPVDTPYPPCPGGKPELMPDGMLKLFIKQAGPDRVLFGTDSTFYPEVVEPRTRRQLEQIKNLDVPEEWKENLLGRNAARIFKIDVSE